MITAKTSALVARLAELLSNERAALADFLVALADFDRQRRWEELGYANLFDFLVRELSMSRGTAFYRKTAVELVQRYPEVLEPLRDGRLCITAVHALSKAITPENRTEVLPRFFHVSKQEAKAISAEIAPVVEVPRREVITAIHAVPGLDLGHEANRLANSFGAMGLAGAGTAARSVDEPRRVVPDEAAVRSPSEPSAPRATIVPLTADDRRLHLTVSPEFLSMLDACKKALSHSMPGADAAAVLAQGMKLILARDARKKGLVGRPRSPGDAGQRRFETRYVPADLRRAVWDRDRGRCQWPVEGGGICGSAVRPEIDHVRGFTPSEPVTADDLRILCKPHDLLHARQVHGGAYMDGFTRRSLPRSPSPPRPDPSPRAAAGRPR